MTCSWLSTLKDIVAVHYDQPIDLGVVSDLEPDNDKDEDSETGKDSSAEVGYETTDVRNHDVTSERPESVDETTVLEGEEETERDPFQFPSSPSELDLIIDVRNTPNRSKRQLTQNS